MNFSSDIFFEWCFFEWCFFRVVSLFEWQFFEWLFILQFRAFSITLHVEDSGNCQLSCNATCIAADFENKFLVSLNNHFDDDDVACEYKLSIPRRNAPAWMIAGEKNVEYEKSIYVQVYICWFSRIEKGDDRFVLIKSYLRWHWDLFWWWWRLSEVLWVTVYRYIE